MKIEIAAVKLDERKGVVRTGDRAGQEYHIRQQEAWLHNGDLHPVKVMVPLEPEQQPYQAGSYTFAPESFEAGDYHRLQFARYPKLAPLLADASVSPRRAG